MRTRRLIARLLVVAFFVVGGAACAAPGDYAGGPSVRGALDKADDAEDDAACIGRGGEFDGVEITRREAELVLDLVRTATRDTLVRALGQTPADAIARARESRGDLCTMDELAAITGVEAQTIDSARRFSATWELVAAGTSSEGEILGDGGTHDGVSLTAGEVFVALEMANFASVEQLDALPGFRSDVAFALVRARRASAGFSSFAEVADVRGVGPSHVATMRDALADWRRFSRALATECGTMDAAETTWLPPPSVCGTEAMAALAAHELEGVAFTAAEAGLALDFANTADLRTLDAVLDTRAARNIAAARANAPLCELAALAAIPYVGTAGLEKLRRFTAVWEAHLRGGGDLATLMAKIDSGVPGVPALFRHQARLALEMASFMTEEQLDAIPGFQSDAARNLARWAHGGYRSLAEVDAVPGVGPAHVALLADHVHVYRAFVRETEERRACASVVREIGATDAGAPATSSIVSGADLATVERSIDAICGDTFCAGDYNWYVEDLACPGDGTCRIALRAQRYGHAFSADALVGRTAESLRVTGTGSHGGYDARVERMQSTTGVWAQTSCVMSGGFRTREDVMDVAHSRYSDRLYESVLDCVSALETVLGTL